MSVIPVMAIGRSSTRSLALSLAIIFDCKLGLKKRFKIDANLSRLPVVLHDELTSLLSFERGIKLLYPLSEFTEHDVRFWEQVLGFDLFDTFELLGKVADDRDFDRVERDIISLVSHIVRR